MADELRPPIPSLRVRNWERFQHYSKRRPPWIRLYTHSDDYAYSQLTLAERGLLHELYKLAGRTDNQIPYDEKWIAKAIQATERVNVEPLIVQGFIELDSSSLAGRKRSATPEVQKNRNTEAQIFVRNEIAATWMEHAPPLIAHRSEFFSARDVTAKVAKALERYDQPSIQVAVENYAQVLDSPDHFFTYRWTFLDFLTRGLDRFVAEADPLTNFLASANGDGVTGDQIMRRWTE